MWLSLRPKEPRILDHLQVEKGHLEGAAIMQDPKNIWSDQKIVIKYN